MKAAVQIPAGLEPGQGTVAVVLDTNIVLDLCVFEDPGCSDLRRRLEQRQWQWLATLAMREELLRVLAYPQIARRLASQSVEATAVMGWYDGHAQIRPAAAKAPYTCKDPDDQKFIDLAVAHGARLLSKDAAVLCMARRLQRLGVEVSPAV